MTHTPGPWEVFKGLYGYGIKGICGGYHGDIDIEADARLIAAAPELLETLRHVEGALLDITCERTSILKGVRAAIAKATGQTK